MARTLRDVVYVDGVRTPFGKAGNDGLHAETRADDLVVRCIRELGLSDGATACLLAAAGTAEELGLPARMRLVGYAFAGVQPQAMGIGPIPATEKLLAQTGLAVDDIGLIELNEAFAVQVLAFLDHFGIPDDDPRVNPWGGAIATGHPLASSGVRLMTQLARQFEENREVRYGLTAMCVGTGMGGAVLWENPSHPDYGKDDER